MVEVLEIADEQGYVLLDDCLEVYSHHQSASKALQGLVKRGLLKSEPAPDVSKKHKIWELTEKGKIFTS